MSEVEQIILKKLSKQSKNEPVSTELQRKINDFAIRIEALERRVDMLQLDFEQVIANARETIISLQNRINRLKRKKKEEEEFDLMDILKNKIRKRIYGLGIAAKTEEE